MKKFLLLFSLLLCVIGTFAQTPSLANMQILWKKQKISDISTQMRSWGYKLTEVEPDNDTLTVAGTAMWMNNIYYNTYTGQWDSKNTKLVNTVKVNWIGELTTIILWHYQSSTTHNSIKNQIKNSGWCFQREEVEDIGISEYYTKKGSQQLIQLIESTDDGYCFIYRIKPDED